MKWARPLVRLAGAILIGIAPAYAQDRCYTAVEAIKPATVKLVARAQVRSGPNASRFVDSPATGVVIADSGFVLTAYHLLRGLGDFAPETLTVTASIGSVSQRAWVIDAEQTTDLLLLKLGNSGPYAHVDLGSAFGLSVGAVLMSYGFPGADLHDVTPKGEIVSKTPDGGSVWAIAMEFKSGQSGSPVIDCDGRLVGIAKGMIGGTGVFVPIEFADPLLAFVRFEGLRREVETLRAQVEDLNRSLDPVRHDLIWSARRVTGGLKLDYRKRVTGGPDPTEAKVELRVFVNGDPNGIPPQMLVATPESVSADGGVLGAAANLEQIEQMIRILRPNASRIEYEAVIDPLFEDGGDGTAGVPASVRLTGGGT
ncbi:S1 family peptidase [Acuticoccus kandeliae]|uniref:S1 family peptidase n=1 Tax=Acuticoccus kandeliae TaxID=2073160 RepID=UPI00130078C8|nr:serine protease [Acuticoccus kandeliae]